MMVKPGDDIFEGMIVGIHSRDNDLVVNAMKAKQLTKRAPRAMTRTSC